MSQTLSLYRLQQIDSKIDRAQSRSQTIETNLKNDIELQKVKERAESINIVCKSADQTLKQAESEANLQRIKLEQTEASLYSSKDRNPKELLDLQNDVAALKRHLVTLEDLQLEAMLTVENALADDQTAQKELLAVEKQSAERNCRLQEEQITLQKELEIFFSERAAIAGPIPPDALGIYNQLRLLRRGIAVAVISENSCSACGAGLSAAQMQSSRASGQMASCPSCGRILYGS